MVSADSAPALGLIALLAGVALETQSLRRRVVCVVLAGLCAVPFAFTLSRASYLGLIPMVLVLAFLSRRRRVMVTLLAFTLLLSPVIVSVLPTAVVNRRSTAVRRRFTPITPSIAPTSARAERSRPPEANLVILRQLVETDCVHAVFLLVPGSWFFVPGARFLVLVSSFASMGWRRPPNENPTRNQEPGIRNRTPGTSRAKVRILPCARAHTRSPRRRTGAPARPSPSPH